LGGGATVLPSRAPAVQSVRGVVGTHVSDSQQRRRRQTVRGK